MRVIVFGAGGHVGSAVCKRLSKGNDVLAMTKRGYNVVTKYGETRMPMTKAIDAAVFCVGHCPPGGFLKAISSPLSKFSPVEFEREMEIHVRGAFNVFQDYLSRIRDGGCFAYLSGAATRILQMPRVMRPHIQMYPHVAMLSAMDALIEGMRMDPMVEERNIKIHLIKPPAIGDSPFHKVKGGLKLLVSVTTDEVVDAIVRSLDAESHLDILVEPTPQTAL